MGLPFFLALETIYLHTQPQVASSNTHARLSDHHLRWSRIHASGRVYGASRARPTYTCR